MSLTTVEQKDKIQKDLLSLYDNLRNHPSREYFKKEVKVLVRSNAFAKANSLPVTSQQLAFYLRAGQDLWLASVLGLLLIWLFTQSTFVLISLAILFVSPVFFLNLFFTSRIEKMLLNRSFLLLFPVLTFLYRGKHYHMPRPYSRKIVVLRENLGKHSLSSHYWPEPLREEFCFLDRSIMSENCTEENFIQYCSDQLVNYHWLLDFMDQLESDRDTSQSVKALQLEYLAEAVSTSKEKDLVRKSLTTELEGKLLVCVLS